MTDAVPGPMTPVSPFDPTVLYVANEAARQLLGPSAYVETVWGAAGRVSLLFVYQCRLLITLANSLDPDKARRSGSKLFDIPMVFLKDFFQNVNLKKNQQTTKNIKKYQVCNELRK